MIPFALQIHLALGIKEPLYVVVESKYPFEYYDSRTKEKKKVPAGSIETSFEYGQPLRLDDRIYFAGEIYLWDLEAKKGYYVKQLWKKPDRKDRSGFGIKEDFAATNLYSGPRIDPVGLRQYGPKGGSRDSRIPSPEAFIRIQNIYVRDLKKANTDISIRIPAVGPGVPPLLSTKISPNGVVKKTLEPKQVIEYCRRHLRLNPIDIESHLGADSDGIRAMIHVPGRSPVPIRLIDDAASPEVDEIKWLRESGNMVNVKADREAFLSALLRTAYLRNRIWDKRREGDLALIGEIVWKNPHFPTWLKKSLPEP